MRNRRRVWRVFLVTVLLLLLLMSSLPVSEVRWKGASDPLERTGGSSGSSGGDGAARGRGLAPTMPDLVLSGLNWSLSAPEDGAALTILATLFNDGTDVPGKVDLSILVDGEPVGTHVLSGLPGGSSATVQSPWTARPGAHEIAALADPANAILEANETNNLRLGGLDIPFPDLAIRNVSWYPRDYRNGDRLTFIVTVQNNGPGGTVRPVNLVSYLDQLRLGSQAIGGLGAGNTAQASFKWTAEPGDHTLFLRLDPDNTVREVTKTDNSYTVRLGRDYPDIVVSALDAPANLTDGAEATLGATVRNIGPAGTFASFPVEFLVDGESIGVVNVNGLQANATRDVSIQWTVRAGRHIVRAEADPRGALDESDETNNFRLQDVEAPYPNLVIRDIRWEQALPTDGRVTVFNITVANTGPGPTVRPVQVEFLVDGQEGGTVVAPGLGAGQEANLTAGWMAVPGNHELRAEADPRGLIDEVDDTDNLLVREMDVPYPDIVLANFTLFPSNPESGQPVRLSAAVSNSGPGNTSCAFQVSFFAGGAKVGTETVSGLDRGAMLNLSATWTAMPGTTDLSAVADWTDTVAESDELNNQAMGHLSVAFPDLSVNLTSWSPANASANQQLNLTAALRNGGANTSLPFRLGLYDNGSLVRSVAVAGMRAGEVIVQNLSFVLGSTPATLRLVADYLNEVPELSELDNGFVLDYPAGTVWPAPPPSDLAFTEVALFPDEPSDGDAVTVRAAINITPAGSASGPDVDVACVLDGVTALVRSVRLSGGEGVAVFELWPPPGAHSLVLVADPGGRIPQDRRDNDRSLAAFTVLASDPALAGLSLPAANGTDGNGVSASCVVTNNGPGAYRAGFAVRLLVDGRPRLTQEAGALSVGAQNTLIFTFDAFPGTHRLKAEIVRDGRLREVDVSNDQARTVLMVDRPDIVVSSINAPGSADEGATVQIQATVANRGASTVRDITVRLLVDGLRSGDATVGGVLAGRSATVIREWTALPGVHRLTALADTGRSIGESDETQNRLDSSAINVSSPDLRVAAVRLLQQPLDGAECLISADIANAGNVTVSAASVQFFIDEAPAGPVRLVAVPAGSDFSVSTRLDVGAGPHLLRASVTGAGRSGSGNRTNDEAVLAVNGTGFPDLSLVGLKVPPAAVDGAPVRLFAEIENAGNATVRPFAVSFLVDGRRAGDCLVEGLPAGGTASVSVTWTATPGRHTVRAIVDREDDVIELNETDNWMRRDGPTVEPPDITVEAVSAVPAPIGSAPDRARIFVELENIGGATLRGVTATVYIGDRPAGKVYTGGLPARTSTQLSLLAPTSGATSLTVRADEDGLLAEGDESNNIAAFPLDPGNFTERSVDISVRRVWMVPPEPSEGEPARLFAEIANEGAGALLDVAQARLLYRGRNSTVAVNGLTPGGASVVGFDITARAGEMVFNVSAYAGKAVAESNRNNNWQNVSFSALAPDLRLAGLVRPDLEEGLESRLFAVVENVGTGDVAGNFAVDVYIGGTLMVQRPVGGLLSGEATCVAFDWRPQPGETDIVLWADRAGVVCETIIDNNRLNQLSEVGYPDLVVSNITWPAHWQNETGASLFVEVSNEGSTTGRSASVTLSVDAAVLGTARVDAMEAGSRTVLAWKWNPSAGNHTFLGSVDTGDEVLESSENNNRLARDFPSGAFGRPPATVNLRLSGLGFQQYRLVSIGADNSTEARNMYRLNFSVQNDGATGTNPCVALLLSDGLPVIEMQVYNLTSNTSRTYYYNWSARSGNYRYKVVLDIKRQLAEDFETDNDDAIAIVDNIPPISATGGTYKVELGDPVTLKGNGADPDGFVALYEWDLDGDGIFGGQNDTTSTTTGTVTKVYHRAGKYRVSLRVTDDQGAMATETTIVSVTERPATPGIDLNQLALLGIAILFVSCVTILLLIFRGEGTVFRRQKS